MAINYEPYGTLAESGQYFENRLHSGPWFTYVPKDRERALLAATRLIDALNFRGCKISDDQPREFPRTSSDGLTPDDIVQATFEMAFTLLVSGKDPEAELEALGITSQGISSVRTTYNRLVITHEHIMSGIVSLHAWRLLYPWLNQKDTINLDRVS